MELISREAAIDALAKFIPYAICDESTESYTNGLTDAYHLILQLPSAQPERKKGKWIPHPNREYKEWDVCTACGTGCKRREYDGGGMTEYSYNFCPYCGADMRGDADETD